MSQVAMWTFAHGALSQMSAGPGASRRVEEAAVGADKPADPGSRGADPGGFEARYREHEEAVSQLCRRMLGAGPAAEDAGHEVFLRAQRGRDIGIQSRCGTQNEPSLTSKCVGRPWVDPPPSIHSAIHATS